jgi:hypothetical protein
MNENLQARKAKILPLRKMMPSYAFVCLRLCDVT